MTDATEAHKAVGVQDRDNGRVAVVQAGQFGEVGVRDPLRGKEDVIGRARLAGRVVFSSHKYFSDAGKLTAYHFGA